MSRISFQQPLTSPVPEVLRFASFASTTGRVGFNLSPGTSINDPLGDNDGKWFAMLPTSWYAVRTSNSGVNLIDRIAYTWISGRRIRPGVNAQTRNMGGINWRNGSTGSYRQPPANVGLYNNDHWAIRAPFAGYLFAPDEFLLGDWTSSGATDTVNSCVWSFDWLESEDPEALAKAVKLFGQPPAFPGAGASPL